MPPEAGQGNRQARTIVVLAALSLAWAAAARAEQRRPTLKEDADCSKCHRLDGHTFTSEMTRSYHQTHGGLPCRECHQVTPHGAMRLGAQKDCSSCHHDPKYHARCPDCHPRDTLPASLSVEQTLQLSVWSQPRQRRFSFAHAQHGSLECTQCHREVPAYRVTVGCGDCHDEHHSPQVHCNECHGDEVLASHARPSHLACATSGCHTFSTPSPVSANRASCVVCHAEQDDHEKDRNCVTCHVPSGHRFPILTGR